MNLASTFVPWHDGMDFLSDLAIGGAIAVSLFCLWGWLAKPSEQEQKLPHDVLDSDGQ